MTTAKKILITRKYKNLSGKSTVVSYALAKDQIKVSFTNQLKYVYSNQVTGMANIAKMKTLAAAGKGLGTFIAANVADKFARKAR